MAKVSILVESEALHARVRAFVRAFERLEAMPESFDTLATDLARYQASHVPGYGRLCAAHGIEPASIRLARQAPAVPTEAFKLGHVFAFDAAHAAATFRTSGTTLGARGTHRMRDVGTYDAAALAFGRAMLAPDLSLPAAVVVLGPAPAEAEDSSLAHMCAVFARTLGVPAPPERTFFVRGGTLDVDALRVHVAGLARSTPALVLATSFALVHLLDGLDGDSLALPPRSRVMQTGGFKGRVREVAASPLRAAVARAFAVDDRAVIGEYGMTELSSQFWETAGARGHADATSHGALETTDGPRRYLEPPWARVIAVDPETLAPVADGDVGIARIEDLANVDSAFAVLTEDLVRRVADGFELLGRMPGAKPRGCSIALEEMLCADQARQ
jgi:hypothetical protein